MRSRGRSSGRGAPHTLDWVLVGCVCLLFPGDAPAVEEEGHLREGTAVASRYLGDPEVSKGLGQSGSGRALAAGDFDEDGVTDVAVAVETQDGTVLVLYRGNVDAIYPNSLDAKQKRAAGEGTDSPFLAPAKVGTTSAEGDLLEAGDFDADDHMDLLVASIGDDSLYLHSGDGQGGFAPAVVIGLPGKITALISGEMNRRDGLGDVIAAVRTTNGPRLLVFENPAGAFAAPPEVVDLRFEATDLALGQLDGSSGVDLAIVAGPELSILHGRDRQRLVAIATPPVMSRLQLGFSIVAVAIGDYTRENPLQNDLAVLSEDGAVLFVTHSPKTPGKVRWPDIDLSLQGWTPIATREWWLSGTVGRLDAALPDNGRVSLLRARVAGGPIDDLVVVGTNGDRFHLMMAERTAKSRPVRSRLSPTPPGPLPARPGDPRQVLKAQYGTGEDDATMSIPPSLSAVAANLESSPRDAVSLRLNGDALSDLVLLVDHRPEPIVLSAKSGEIVVVNSTTDLIDGVTTSISDLNASPGADGVISLREAITAANNTVGADAVNFNIPLDTDPGCDVGSGVCTIQPGGSGLPTITQPVTIDGSTQPSFLTTPVIEIDGSLAASDATGLAMNAGSSTIRSLVINRFATNSDIVMWGAGGNVVEGNFLGIDSSGTFNRGTTNSVHVYAISNNTIGGTTAAARNVISGNTNPAVALNAGASNNLVQGNFIGTDLTGTVALGNSGNDVVTLDSPDNTIGGTAAGAGNLIAGNLDSDFASVGLGYPASTGNLVQGNFVGTDLTGTIALGGASIGVYIADGSNNTVGGTTPAAANLISGGDSSGVGIASGSGNFVQGNLIGTQIDGETPLPNSSHGVLIYSGAGNNTVGGRTTGAGNTIAFNGDSGVDLRGDAGIGNTVAGNSIIGNAELGINSCSDFDLATLICNDATGVTLNDPNDPDMGVNNLQNFPDLNAIRGGSSVDGSLDSIASSEFTIDFYASRLCDPSGHGEGETYLGSDIVATNADGDATFTSALAIAAPVGWFVVATATDSGGSTSEFSQCLGVSAEPIFTDSFESGDTTVWSAVMPPA